MDWTQLAKETAQTLAPFLPFLPFLVEGEKAAAEKLGEKFTEAAWTQAESLWKKLNSNPAAQKALRKAALKPEEERAITLETRLEIIFEQDESFAQSIRTGDYGIAIGGNATDNKIGVGNHNQIADTIVNNNYPAPPTRTRKNKKQTQPSERSSLEEMREAYLSGIITDCKRARLSGVDPQAADVTRGAFSLDRLYVSLDTATPLLKEKERKEIAPNANASIPESFLDFRRPLSALEVLCTDENRRVVLLGLPGSGKSTFVRYLSLRNAQSLLDPDIQISEQLPGWEGSALTPIIVSLGRFAESLPAHAQRGTAKQMEKFIAESIQAEADFARDLLKQAKQDGALFLFDGLDEVADLERRPVVVQAVEEFAATYGRNKNSRFLVTCRTFSYTDPHWQLTDWTAHELAPLTPQKINDFIDCWHSECISIDPAREVDYQDKREKMRKALRRGDPRRLWEIADNPLILTIMAVVHTHKGDLPDSRAQVYEDCVEILLLRWESERTVTGKPQRLDLRTALDLPKIAILNALQEIAYHAHERKQDDERTRQAALVTEDLLRADLHAAFNDAKKVQTFLDYCEGANGLLMLQGVAPLPEAPPDSPPRRVYTFPHLTFEEYLAARYIRRMPNLGQKTLEHLIRSDRWRETVMLLGEYICFQDGNYELMDSILQTLAPPSCEPKNEQDWKARWAAGDLLILYRRAFEQRKSHHTHIPNTLVRLLAESALPARERAEAGDTLARLGDPRFDEAQWRLPKEPLFGFVKIPAGEFTMGTREEDIKGLIEKFGGKEEWYKAETPQHKVTLDEYYMACYPVTVAQFTAFVKDSGYKPRDEDSLRGVPNHPVRYVNWYDALEYCIWLNEKLKSVEPISEEQKDFLGKIRAGKLIVSLPSEAEWEKAARHSPLPKGEGRVREFPWEGEFDQEKANNNNVIGHPSAVGCFSNGKSPYGMEDMAGNVWEWTRSEYKPYPCDPDEKLEKVDDANIVRVLRGGAFNNSEWRARCAYRGWYLPPVEWLNVNGFRVCVVSVFPFF